ncbi:MAG: hypothetical protein J5I47_04470 [Vicingus serpentipes]|nr:hypothetical protein [Vicingus serpentipes]
MKTDYSIWISKVIIPLLLFIVGLYTFAIRIIGYDFTYLPGDMGDTRFNNYILEHGYQYLTGQVKEYWSAPFLYPTKNVIAYSDNLLGSVPLYSLFRAFDFGRETSFQLWFLVLSALNFACCYVALNKWFNNAILASVGAYIFAFGIYNLGMIGHAQVFPKFMIPLIFYWVWQYLSKKEIKYFFFTTMAVVYQFYCGIYLGFFVIYALLFIVGSYFVAYRDIAFFHQFKNKKNNLIFFSTLLLAGITIYPLIYPYFELSRVTGLRTFDEIVNSIPHPLSYFFVQPASFLWKEIFYIQNPCFEGFDEWWVHFLFPGVLPWVTVICMPVILFYKKRKKKEGRMGQFLFLAFLLSMIFCMNFNGFIPYKLIYRLPGFASMRALNRIINVEIMFFILIAIYVSHELSKKSFLKLKIIYFLPLLVIMDNVYNLNWDVRRFNKEESIQKVEVIKNQISQAGIKKHQVVAVALNKEKENSHIDIIDHHISVMLASQELHLSCVNGYSGSYPDNYMSFFDNTDLESLTSWCQQNNISQDAIHLVNFKRE